MSFSNIRELVKRATKSEVEKEDEAIASLVRRNPDKKPPRKDLRENVYNTGDPDLQGLGRRDGETHTCLGETGRWVVEGISKGAGYESVSENTYRAERVSKFAYEGSFLLKTSASKEDIAKARETLKDKSYKDPESGKDISFSTAYNRSVHSGSEGLRKSIEGCLFRQG